MPSQLRPWLPCAQGAAACHRKACDFKGPFQGPYVLPPQWSSTVWLLCCSLADEVHQIPAISLGLDEQQSCKLHLCKPTQAASSSLLNQPKQEPKTRLPDIGPCLDFLQILLKIIAKQGPSFGAIFGARKWDHCFKPQ